MSETEEIQPYENTLDEPELRSELRRAWDGWAAIRKDLRSLPEVPSIMTLRSFINSSSWLDFHAALKIGHQMQRVHGLDAIPPKCEYELSAAHYKFIRDAILEKLAREAAPPQSPAKEG